MRRSISEIALSLRLRLRDAERNSNDPNYDPEYEFRDRSEWFDGPDSPPPWPPPDNPPPYNGLGTITVGFFRDPEKRLASIFCAIGHILTDRSGKSLRPVGPPGKAVWPPGGEALLDYDRALMGWEEGLSLAEKEGYTFSPDVLAWCDEQLETTIDYEEREVRGWKDGPFHDPKRVYPRHVLRNRKKTP